MIELGQLERRHEDFTRRHTQVIVVSVEGLDAAKQTQADFPHLLVLADEGRGLSDAVGLIHAHAAPDGSDTATPTTSLAARLAGLTYADFLEEAAERKFELFPVDLEELKEEVSRGFTLGRQCVPDRYP